MPREKVPYGAAECGRAQKEKEIEVKLEKKLETVNNVSGDAAHNLVISGSKGVTVKTDEARHKIALEVDTSELGDVVHTDRSETVTGAKTFAGDQVFTGAVGMSGAVNATGAVTANNTKNVIKAANHTEVLTGNDVLTAADIMTANGSANNLVHRTGNETLSGVKTFDTLYIKSSDDEYVGLRCQINSSRAEAPAKAQRAMLLMKDSDGKDVALLTILRSTDGSLALTFGGWPLVDGTPVWKQTTICKFNTDGTIS